MAELDALTQDPETINKRLEEHRADCHLVSPAEHFDVLPAGWAVSFDFVKVDASDPRQAAPGDDERSFTLTAKVMQSIARKAGIDWDHEASGRKGDCSHPHYVEYVAVGYDKGIDGAPRRCVGEVALDLSDDSEEAKARMRRALERGRDQQIELDKDRRFIHRAAETQAQARAVANGLGLRRDYTAEELQKPFAIVRMVFVGPVQKPFFETRPGLFHQRQAGSFRFALVGDTHNDQHSRFDEHNRIMAFVGEDAARRGCDAIFHSGDVNERKSTTSIEREANADYFTAWADRMPVVVVKGNHDDRRDIDLLGRLKARHPIHAITSPQVITLGRAAIACVPWPHKGSVLAKLGIVAREQGNQVATEMLRGVLRDLGEQLARHQGGPRIFLGHCSMRGSKTSEAQPPLVGHDFELTLDDLRLVGASFNALGHIHQGQQWELPLWPATVGHLCPVVYPGSPRRCNWGEPEPKGYVIGEFEGDRLVSWERIPTPCAPMLTVDVRFERGSLVLSNEDANLIEQSPGAEVRIRYDVPADQRVAAKGAAEDLAELLKVCGGAVRVDLDDTVTTEVRARAPEVAAAKTLPAQVEAHWNSVGFEPGERRDALLEKAIWLAEQVSEAAAASDTWGARRAA